MTHDELLAELDELDHSCSVVGITVSALRAVVELHKPDVLNPEQCEVCTLHTDYSHRYIVYPCETIQAIEKELG